MCVEGSQGEGNTENRDQEPSEGRFLARSLGGADRMKIDLVFLPHLQKSVGHPSWGTVTMACLLVVRMIYNSLTTIKWSGQTSRCSWSLNGAEQSLCPHIE